MNAKTLKTDNPTKNAKLGEILLSRGLLSKDQVKEVVEAQKTSKKKFGEILVEKSFITEKELAEFIADMFQLPFIDLSTMHINEKLLNLFSHSVLDKLKILPVEIKDNYLVVATNDPLDVSALQEIRYISGYQIKPVVATLHDINKFLNRSYQSMQTLEAIKGAKSEGIQDAPIVKLVNTILTNAIKEGASDIHCEPQKNRLRVRFRIDGILYEKISIPKDLMRKVISRIKILAGMDVAETRKPQDGRISMTEGGLEYDLRISTIQDLYGENVVLRILNKNVIYKNYESLGMAASEISMLKQLVTRPYGMILVTGPTGSGKTTTLYSTLNLLNDPAKNIITVEDPVEYEVEGITQTAASPFTGYNFATAIRHILRHDPDIIMVGEIRDVETAEVAIRAALTGHLVLSTLHTNSAAGAITRLLDMNIEPFLISSAVIGVIAQRLVRKLCPHCKKLYTPDPHIIDDLKKNISVQSDIKLAQSVGCEKCFQTGYAGRSAIYEMFQMNEDIRKSVLNHANEQTISRQAIGKGMKTLRMSGYEKALAHETTLTEILRATHTED